MQLCEVLNIDESPHARQFRHVVSVVDQLHRFPKLPAIPVLITKSRRESGGYIYRVRPPIPLSINISGNAEFPALTLLHELGHLLDHLALNPIKQGFGSEHDPLFDRLRNFWTMNNRICRLTKIEDCFGEKTVRSQGAELSALSVGDCRNLGTDLYAMGSCQI